MQKTAAQGEIQIYREGAPDLTGFKPYEAGLTGFVIGHSESGHHHVIDRAKADVYVRADYPAKGMQTLLAIVKEPTALVNLRPSTVRKPHDPVALEPGAYRFVVGREFDHLAKMERKQAD